MTDPKNRRAQSMAKQGVVESLKDLGSQSSKDFFDQLLGKNNPKRKISGELNVGETMDMQEAFDGKAEENKKLRAQIALERNLAAEESQISKEKISELRVQLQALVTEISRLAEGTEKLAKEAAVATMSVPIEPGIYHINFFEKLLLFLQSFRKKIDAAATWLHTSNKRAEKKNYWSMYKKKGSSFLLAPDHYLQRSAG